MKEISGYSVRDQQDIVNESERAWQSLKQVSGSRLKKGKYRDVEMTDDTVTAQTTSDVTDTDTDNTLTSLEKAVEATILSIIAVVAFVGNVSLWIIVLRNRSLHTASNALVLCLSAADVLVSVINMPVTVLTIARGRWVLSHTACVAIGYITMVTFIGSVMSLAAISTNRYVLVCRAARMKVVYTRRNTTAIIAGGCFCSEVNGGNKADNLKISSRNLIVSIHDVTR